MATYTETDADLLAIKEAILNGADAGWAVTVEQLVGLQEASPEFGGAFMTMDDTYRPRALTLTLPVAQHLFRVLGLTPYGCARPEHDAVYGTKEATDDERAGE